MATSDSDRHGRIAESVVCNALAKMRADSVILDFTHAQTGRQIDAMGIDMLVQLPSGLFFGMQCKCSLGHVCRHFEIHPHVQYVIVIGARRRQDFDEWSEKFIVKNQGLKAPPFVVLVNAAVPEVCAGEDFDACVAKAKIGIGRMIEAAFFGGKRGLRKISCTYIE